MAFGSTDPDVARALGRSNDAWDGHCWIALGPYVGDASLFRTAYGLQEDSNLRSAVLDEFGPGRGLLLMPWAEAAKAGFEYIPKYVATEVELTGLIQGAAASGGL
jgi:hypothetical protein